MHPNPTEAKPTIIGTRYVLAVKDLKKSAAYYRDQLGFAIVWQGDGWHFLQREKCIVMLGECKDEKAAYETGDHSYFAYIDMSNIDSLYKEFQLKIVDIISPIEDKPWGQREFAIRTIDGHRINFGEEIKN